MPDPTRPGRPPASTPTRSLPTGQRQHRWEDVRTRLHERGLRWTPQRRLLVEVLASTRGHVTGSELVERCRELDEATTPSTVYRTLDVLEEIGYVRHAHGLDGREEFHVLPVSEHGHLHCSACGHAWEIGWDEVAGLVRDLQRRRGFDVDLGHLTVVGLCRDCRSRGPAGRVAAQADPGGSADR